MLDFLNIYLVNCSICCFVFLSLNLGRSALPVQLDKAQSNILPELNMLATTCSVLELIPCQISAQANATSDAEGS